MLATILFRGFGGLTPLTLLFWVVVGVGQAVSQQASEVTVCDRAAIRVAAETGVPVDLLLTITRIETGRTVAGRVTPWPWTSNILGTGHWYDSRSEAAHALSRVLQTGERSFDVGCFQLNYRWHGARFTSIDAMLDPYENARYAAGFLQRLLAEFGTWEAAIGAYHSRTPRHASRYLARFHQLHARMETPVLQTAVADPDVTHPLRASPLDYAPRPSLWARQNHRNVALSPPHPARGFPAVAPLWGASR